MKVVPLPLLTEHPFNLKISKFKVAIEEEVRGADCGGHCSAVLTYCFFYNRD